MINEKNYVEKIQNEYSSKKQTKLDELKALDKKVKVPPRIFGISFGTISSLILGTGMCLAMKVIGGTTALMSTGTIIGVIGIGLCLSTYPIYKKMLEKRKQKYSKEILEISNALLIKED